jgi:hypothetical protein
VRVVLAWALWWSLLFALWLAYVGVLASPESAVGAGAAAIGATMAEAVRAQGLMRFQIEPRWLLRSLRVPWDVLVQFGIVTLALLRRERPHGRLKTVPFPPRATAGSRALAAWADTLSPNDYVLEIEDGEAVKHVLMPGRSSDSVL